jgi:hypothetical protein
MSRHVALALILLAPLAAPAADDDFKPEPGFVRLDSGKDLEGWTGNKDGWSVADGAVVHDANKAKGNIYSEKTNSKNCIIRFQFKATDGADSGFYVHGSQFQVRDYPKAGPKQYAGPAKPAGEWNEMEMDFTDGVAVVKLNGEVIEKAFKAGGNAKQGVGLQKERGDFAFRRIVIKEKEKK